MCQPLGFLHPHFLNHVCKLKKAIYILKQAPRAWYHFLQDFLLSYGFSNSKTGPSLFIYKTDKVLAYFLVYIDDLLLTRNNLMFFNTFLTALANKFSLKDLGTLTYFLKVDLLPIATGMFYSQSSYIWDILTKANMCEAKLVNTPMSTSCTFNTNSRSTNITLYRSLVGSLQYLSLTCLDVAFIVNWLA